MFEGSIWGFSGVLHSFPPLKMHISKPELSYFPKMPFLSPEAPEVSPHLRVLDANRNGLYSFEFCLHLLPVLMTMMHDVFSFLQRKTMCLQRLGIYNTCLWFSPFQHSLPQGKCKLQYILRFVRSQISLARIFWHNFNLHDFSADFRNMRRFVSIFLFFIFFW